MMFDTKTRITSCVYLLLQEHDSPAGLDGADFSVFVHGNHQQAVHHPFLPLTGVHQQVGAAGQTQTICRGRGMWEKPVCNRPSNIRSDSRDKPQQALYPCWKKEKLTLMGM